MFILMTKSGEYVSQDGLGRTVFASYAQRFSAEAAALAVKYGYAALRVESDSPREDLTAHSDFVPGNAYQEAA